MMTVGFNTNSFGIGGNYASNPFGAKNDEHKKDKSAYMNPFQGFNMGTGSHQTDASAIRACGNSLDLQA